jgi:hypothetical protein
MVLKNGAWLADQQDRGDLIGDLARLPIMHNSDTKSSRRRPDEHNVWADIVIGISQPGSQFSSTPGRNFYWQSKPQQTPWIDSVSKERPL